jgi:hypothetical protein
MLDGVTLDQLRSFIAGAEQVSFCAAGRKANAGKAYPKNLGRFPEPDSLAFGTVGI